MDTEKNLNETSLLKRFLKGLDFYKANRELKMAQERYNFDSYFEEVLKI